MSRADSIAKIGSGAKGAATAVAILAATALVIYTAWKLKQGASAAGDALEAAGQAVNPTSDQNLAYQGANSIIGCGDGSCSLGTRVYDGVQWLKDLFGASSAVAPADPTQKLLDDAASDPGREYTFHHQ